MDKYINVDKSIKDIKEVFCKPCKERGDDYHGVSCRACKIEDCIDIIDAEPKPDVQKVGHCKKCNNRHSDWCPMYLSSSDEDIVDDGLDVPLDYSEDNGFCHEFKSK